jgi:hypothetical protein
MANKKVPSPNPLPKDVVNMLASSQSITGNNASAGMFDGQLDDPNKHLTELLKTDGDIDGKTDLKDKHIRALIKIKQLAYALGDQIKDSKGNVSISPDPTILSIISDFKRLRISKDRKSRGEFVSGIQGSNQMNRQENMFNRLGNWFKGA